MITPRQLAAIVDGDFKPEVKMNQPVMLEVTRVDENLRHRLLIPISSILYIQETQPVVIVLRTARIEIEETYEQIRAVLGGAALKHWR